MVEYSLLTDDELLRLTSEDREAFGEFYGRHVRAVLGELRRRGLATEEALDLAAEVFAAALVASRRYRPGEAPARAWLLGIARNKLAHRRRRAAGETAARRKLGMARLTYSDEALERVEDLLEADAGVLYERNGGSAASGARSRGGSRHRRARLRRDRGRVGRDPRGDTSAREPGARKAVPAGRQGAMRSAYVEHDALAALRDELVSAAGRGVVRRRRRRRAVTGLAAVVVLLAVAAGAAALANLGTGVSAIDELLDVEHGYSGPGGLPAGRGTEPVDVRMGDGVYQFVAYLNRRGEIVTAFAQRHRGGVRGGGSGGGPRAADLARTLKRRGVVLHGASYGAEQRVWWGYADGSVKAVRVNEPVGDWTVKMSPPWRPPAQGARPLRVLVVIDQTDIDVGGDGPPLDEPDRLMQPEPKIEPVYRKRKSSR